MFASGALTVEYSTLSVYIHLTSAPLFASVSLPPLSLLSSLMQQQQMAIRDGTAAVASDTHAPDVSLPASILRQQPLSLRSAPPSPHRPPEQQQQQRRCYSCGETLGCCMAGSSPTAATIEILLVAFHKQRHQGPLLSFLAAKETIPSILMSAVATVLGILSQPNKQAETSLMGCICSR